MGALLKKKLIVNVEFYDQVIEFIRKKAEGGRLCSEAQFKKMAKALTRWREGGAVGSREAKARWYLMRGKKGVVLKEETGLSKDRLSEMSVQMTRNWGEKGYWQFEDAYGESPLIKFGAYLSGRESLADAGERLGWTRQAVYSVVKRIFGSGFSGILYNCRRGVVGFKNTKVTKKTIEMLGEKASRKLFWKLRDATLGNRPELLIFRLGNITMRVVPAQALKGGGCVYESEKVGKADYVIAFAKPRDFYVARNSSNLGLAMLPPEAKENWRIIPRGKGVC